MTDPTDVQNCIEKMKIHMELRGLRPMTVSTFTGYARRFLAHVGKARLRHLLRNPLRERQIGEARA